MKTLPDRIQFLLLATLLLALPFSVRAQYGFSIDAGGYATIEGATGTPVNVTIPSTILGHTVIAVRDHAYQNCSTLVSITLPPTIQSIGSFAFTACPHLTSISISGDPYGYSSTGGVLFHGNQLMVYPAGLSGNYTIPDGTTSIGPYAFGYSPMPLNVTFPASVTSIGDEAFFSRGAMTNIMLGGGVTTLGIGTFDGCNNLTNISVDAANTNFSSVNGVLFDKSGKQLVIYPSGLTGPFTIPNGVTNIASYAFLQCQDLTKLKFPPSITSMSDNAVEGCYGLTSIFFEGNAPIGSSNMIGSGTLTFYYLPGTTGWDTFPTNGSYGKLTGVLWNPQIVNTDGNLGFQNNQFGFNVTGDDGLTVVVEGTTNFTDWQPVCTNGLNGDAVYFSDPQWTNYPGRFYRIASP